MSTPDFIDNPDARAWAEEFATVVKRGEVDPTDTGWLVGWFANAMACGHRHARGDIATTVEQWRVAGVRDLGFPPTQVVFKSSDTRWDGEPERAARRFIAEAGDSWAEGPYLDHREVPYPRWQRVP
jgi:hypothetical protein